MSDDENEDNSNPKIEDELSEDSLGIALNCLKEKNYKGIVESITGINDESKDGFEKTLDLIKGIFEKNTVDEKKASMVIKHVYYLFAHHSSNIAALDSNYVSYASQFSPGTYPPEQASGVDNMLHEKVTKESLLRLNDFQLSNKIREVREKHKKLLSRGEKISKELVENLNLLLEENASRQGGGVTKKKLSDEDKNSQEELGVSSSAEKGKYKFWFIQPTEDEIIQTINIHVVCGSPMIDVLRKRYKKQYSLKEITDIRPQEMLRSSAEEQYELKKEKKRQEDFVSAFFDPKNISDQDICAYSIYSAMNTDQYPEVPRVREQANTLGVYFLKHGRLLDRFDTDKRIHSLTVDGNIIGRFSVACNKREKVSGRIIQDSYEIIEYHNGRPVLYFYSSRGRSALDQKTLNNIVVAMRGVKMNLLTPVPAEISDDKALDKYKAQNNKSDEDSIATEENQEDTNLEVEQGAEASIVEPEAEVEESQVAEEEPVSEEVPAEPIEEVEQEEPVEEIAPEEQVEAPKKAPKSKKKVDKVETKPQISIEVQEKTVSAKKKGPEDVDLSSAQLRTQLINGIKRKYSQSTLNYLLDQIAEKEGKTSDDVKNEIIASMPEANQIFDRKKLNVGIIKERAKKIKESMDVTDQDKKDSTS